MGGWESHSGIAAIQLERQVAMVTRVPKPCDITQWIEPIPRFARAGGCLPAFGGRVLIRGYDTYRSRLMGLEDSRWGLDETLVPLAPATAARTDGPAGRLYPGDCVIFIGISSDSPTPLVWYPQRVIHVADGPANWQRVWTIRDFDRDDDRSPDIEPGRIPRRLMSGEALHGNDRRAVLEWYGLNLECEHCGSHGGAIVFGPLVDPMPDAPYGGESYRIGDDTYWCTCGSRWFVKDDGELVHRPPMPVM